MNFSAFWGKLKGHPAFRVGSSYAVIAFISVQVISLVAASFNLQDTVVQGVILASFIGFPLVILLSIIISSQFSTAKLLAIFAAVVVAVYLGGSLYWIQFVKSPELEKALGDDEYAKTWMIARQIDRIFPFHPYLSSEYRVKIHP